MIPELPSLLEGSCFFPDCRYEPLTPDQATQTGGAPYRTGGTGRADERLVARAVIPAGQ